MRADRISPACVYEGLFHCSSSPDICDLSLLCLHSASSAAQAEGWGGTVTALRVFWMMCK